MRVRSVGSTILPIDALGSNFLSLGTVRAGAAQLLWPPPSSRRAESGSGTAGGGGGDRYGWFPLAVAPPNSPVFGPQLSVLLPFPQGHVSVLISPCHSGFRFFFASSLFPFSSNLCLELLGGRPDPCENACFDPRDQSWARAPRCCAGLARAVPCGRPPRAGPRASRAGRGAGGGGLGRAGRAELGSLDGPNPDAGPVGIQGHSGRAWPCPRVPAEAEPVTGLWFCPFPGVTSRKGRSASALSAKMANVSTRVSSGRSVPRCWPGSLGERAGPGVRGTERCPARRPSLAGRALTSFPSVVLSLLAP